MISLSTYREKLGEKSLKMSDEELKKLRDLQYRLADIIIDLWIKKQRQSLAVDKSSVDDPEKS